jgi:hypothetical protein
VFVPILSSIGPAVWPPMLDIRGQDVTETVLEKYNILEPVSVGGWKKIRLRRITHSSTCVCLRLRKLFLRFCFAPRCACPTLAPCSIPVLSFLYTLARIGCAAPIARTQTPINCAYCPNCFLYHFGVHSVQPFGRQCLMCGAARTFSCASICTHDRRPP